MNKKRLSPEEITPILYNGIKYTVPHFSAFNKDMKHNGGYIEAFDNNNKRIWLKEIYSPQYILGKEKDVEDIFIKSIKIESNTIIIINENNKRFEIYL